MGKKGKEFDAENAIIEIKEDNKPLSLKKSIILIVLGIVGLKIGGDLF